MLVRKILENLRIMVLALQRAIPLRSGLFCRVRNGWCASYPADGLDSSICHSTTLGFIISELGQAEQKVVWARFNPYSIQYLVKKIKSITVK